MSAPTDASAMPAEMLEKLHAVRRHERRVRLQTALTRACAVLLTAMLAMMALDWLTTPGQGFWRWVIHFSALACGGAALLIGGLIPLLRPRSLDAIAAQVDRAHPSLQERYQTVNELAQSNDQPAIRGSEGMIRKVAQQTAALSGSVVPGAVVSKQGLICASRFLGAAAAVMALFFILDFPRATVLCRRFFQPDADITLTRLQAKSGEVTIGKGENVTLEFTATGKATRSAQLPSIPPRAARRSWFWTRTPNSPAPACPNSSIPPMPSPNPFPTVPVPETAGRRRIMSPFWSARRWRRFNFASKPPPTASCPLSTRRASPARPAPWKEANWKSVFSPTRNCPAWI